MHIQLESIPSVHTGVNALQIISFHYFRAPGVKWGVKWNENLQETHLFLVSAAVFQSELNNLQKRPKYVENAHYHPNPHTGLNTTQIISFHYICAPVVKWSEKSLRNSFIFVFQLELNNLQKRPKYVKKCHFWDGFSKFIQLWLKNSDSNPKVQIPCSFLLHLTPCLTPY